LIRATGTKESRRLTGVEAVRVGSVIDAKAGEVELTAQASAGGPSYTSVFRGGIFKVTQTSRTTELRLSEALAPCGGSRSSKPKLRRLRGAGSGPFLIRGRYSGATSLEGVWVVEDTCRGTSTRVTTGVAEVTRRGRSSRVKVRAGKTYLASAP
jgi:hypothetical protein